jgi:hypothetical protein
VAVTTSSGCFVNVVHERAAFVGGLVVHVLDEVSQTRLTPPPWGSMKGSGTWSPLCAGRGKMSNTCLRCQKEFTGRSDKIYCTEKCRKKAEQKRYDERGAVVRFAKQAVYLAEHEPIWAAARAAKEAARRPRGLKAWVGRAVFWPSGCLLWVGPVDDEGYPRIKQKGRLERVARLICGVEDDRRACHTCDVPSCINPDHLYVGTAKQNTADMMRRGRWPMERVNGRFARKAASEVG